MSPPQQPGSHPMFSVPQDELSSQFFNFSRQQCLPNQLRNYWHEILFPAGRSRQSPGEKNPPRAPKAGLPAQRHPFSSAGQFLILNQSYYLFWGLLSSPNFWQAQGLGTKRNEFAGCRFIRPQVGKQLSKFPKLPAGINDSCHTGMIQWETPLVLREKKEKRLILLSKTN